MQYTHGIKYSRTLCGCDYRCNKAHFWTQLPTPTSDAGSEVKHTCNFQPAFHHGVDSCSYVRVTILTLRLGNSWYIQLNNAEVLENLTNTGASCQLMSCLMNTVLYHQCTLSLNLTQPFLQTHNPFELSDDVHEQVINMGINPISTMHPIQSEALVPWMYDYFHQSLLHSKWDSYGQQVNQEVHMQLWLL